MNEAAFLKTLDEKMKKTLQNLKGEFGKIRGNRATVTLLDDVRVDYYGTSTPLNQMATLSTPEPRTITISPWDKTAIPAIEKAIQASGLGLGSNNDGHIVRVTLPSLTEERRRDLVKHLKKIAEETRVALRNVRRDTNELVKAELKSKTITEDDEKRLLKKIQEATDEFVKNVDAMAGAKEKDVMEV